jgi:hypothetical protein
MDTYQNVHRTLLDLERQFFPAAAVALAAPSECVTGGIQFAALDSCHCQSQRMLPVVCVLGINYTQEARTAASFYCYTGGIGSGIIKVDAGLTGCRKAVADLVKAYNRNVEAWLSTGLVRFDPSVGEVGPFGSPSATAGISEDFILVMTNRSPFITGLKWQEQVAATSRECDALLNAWPNNEYLNDLYSQLGKSVDLWIGHSAIDGTKWVFPFFRALITRYNIKAWLLTPNVSSQTSLNIRRYFSSPGHRLYPLFRHEHQMPMTLQEIRETQTRSVAEILSATLYNHLEHPGVVLFSNANDSAYLYVSYSSKVSQIVFDHQNNDNRLRKKCRISREEFSTYPVRIFETDTVEEAKVLKEQILRVINPQFQ